MWNAMGALGLGLLVLGTLGEPAAAQTEYPARPIRIIVGFAPGGATDVATRIVSARLSEELGAQVIVENKPGASTSIAGAAVASAEPDGYTLFMAGNANAVNALNDPKPPFDVLRDFVPAGIVVTSPSVLVTSPSAGIASVRDLIDKAKAEPGRVTFGSAGAAAVSHLAGELFALQTNTRLTHIPYKGSALAMTDVLAGRVTIMFAPIATALPFIKEGKLATLAVTSPHRQKELPNAPTLAEAGIKDLDIGIWFGLVAPAGTPAERVARLEAALGKALGSPEVGEQLAVHGMEPAAERGPAAFTARMKADIDKLQKLFTATGLKLGR